MTLTMDDSEAWLRCYPPILGYHRVGSFKEDHVPTVSAEAFKRQLEFLTRYHVVSLDELVEKLERAEMPPRGSVALTFDDGYEETYHVAWPLLKRFRFPATLFVTPGEVGRPGFASWEQIKELSADGINIGNHTMHHSYLPLVTEDQLHEELIASKGIIEDHIGQPVRFLSYPVGGFTARIQDMVRQAGYLAACTTNRTLSREKIDCFALRRVKITERDVQPITLWVKLSGYYDLFRRLKSPA